MLQFHAVTDSHDQIRSAIQARKNTCNLHDHNLPNHVFAGNPHRPKEFFYEMFDSLVDHSKISVSNLSNNVSNSIENETSTIVESKEDQVALVSTNQDVNTFWNTLRDQLSEEEPTSKDLGLDCK